MKSIGFLCILAACCTACHTATQNNQPAERFTQSTPDQQRKELLKRSQPAGCTFTNPDTSLSGICIGDAATATAVIGNQNKLDDNGQYHFYSHRNDQVLTLTQQPGDYENQISVFKVSLGDKADYGYRTLPIDSFGTEKGIRLGITKEQIIARLGHCYTAIDSSSEGMELYYRIELPADSKTLLLSTHNMPVYYATYHLWHNKLQQFEFGFEYP